MQGEFDPLGEPTLPRESSLPGEPQSNRSVSCTCPGSHLMSPHPQEHLKGNLAQGALARARGLHVWRTWGNGGPGGCCIDLQSNNLLDEKVALLPPKICSRSHSSQLWNCGHHSTTEQRKSRIVVSKHIFLCTTSNFWSPGDEVISAQDRCGPLEVLRGSCGITAKLQRTCASTSPLHWCPAP
eukprot:1151980-Pelagomonas_calceolata.AAC.1